MTPEAKLLKARQLQLEASVEIRAREQLARAADRCACGHRRDQHAMSISINYTEGFCMACPLVKGHSTCRWFHYKPASPEDRTP